MYKSGCNESEAVTPELLPENGDLEVFKALLILPFLTHIYIIAFFIKNPFFN
jgi:hypothetical protein